MWRRRSWLLLGLALAAGLAHAQAGGEPQLTVALADGRTRVFARGELEKLPRETVQVRLRDGAPFPAAGVSVTTLLREAGLGRWVRQPQALEVTSLP